MRRPEFHFVEPSKVGVQHITLLEGFLRAIASNPCLRKSFELVLSASRSTLDNLPSDLVSQFRVNCVPVMNPESRRLVRKSILELAVVVRQMIALRRGDICFVSCLLPTTLLMLELVNRVLRKRSVHVVLHGEVEGLFDHGSDFRRIWFWSSLWMKLRDRNSAIRLVAIDDFIKAKLLEAFPKKIDKSRISVVHFPIVALALRETAESPRKRACFIGYRTKMKAFDSFARLATEHPDIEFVAIGGGRIEDMATGTMGLLPDKEAYLSAIGDCTVAVFLHSSNYICSLSSALIDAVTTGVPVLALDRPCFRSLAAELGPDYFSIHRTFDELSDALRRWPPPDRARGDQSYVARLARSKFGLAAVREEFTALALGGAS